MTGPGCENPDAWSLLYALTPGKKSWPNSFIFLNRVFYEGHLR